MKKNHIEYLLSVREKAIENGLLPDGMLDFYSAIFEYQEKAAAVFDAADFGTSRLRSDAFPVIDPDLVEFSRDELSALDSTMADLTSVIKEFQPGINLHGFSDYCSTGDHAVERAYRALVRNDVDELKVLSGELRTGIEEYVFVLTQWFKPWLIHLRSTQEQYGEYQEPVCPFCGYLPDMSKIVESKDNIRLLHCGLCESEWTYKRLSCVICGNENGDTLGFYTYDDDPAYRIDYCDECRGYIKTVRLARGLDGSACDLAVENIITAFLDSSAMELGYSRP